MFLLVETREQDYVLLITYCNQRENSILPYARELRCTSSQYYSAETLRCKLFRSVGVGRRMSIQDLEFRGLV